jgi:hypothetical protein
MPHLLALALLVDEVEELPPDPLPHAATATAREQMAAANAKADLDCRGP